MRKVNITYKNHEQSNKEQKNHNIIINNVIEGSLKLLIRGVEQV
jgi:hypothetical protein